MTDAQRNCPQGRMGIEINFSFLLKLLTNYGSKQVTIDRDNYMVFMKEDYNVIWSIV